MARRSDHTREQLTELIVQSAQDILCTDGINALTARAIAKRIGYTPGTLYQCFKDINAILLSVHARTLSNLASKMYSCPPNIDSRVMLHDYADIYLQYVRENKKAWDALFEYRHPKDFDPPGWYTDYIDNLIGRISDCFERLPAGKGTTTPSQAAQMIWASVHSVCSLDGQGRLGMIMDRELEPLVHHLVDVHVDAYIHV